MNCKRETGVFERNYRFETLPEEFLYCNKEEKYLVAKSILGSYQLLELGVVCFRMIKNRYSATGFSVKFFPRNYAGIERPPLRISPGAIQLLRGNKFDFNATFDHGFSLLSKNDADKLRNKILLDVKLSEEEKARAVDEIARSEKVRVLLKSLKKKIVIFHNAFLDILHILKIEDDKLPDTLDDYKKGAMELFMGIIDTKHLARQDKVKGKPKNTSLDNLIRRFTRCVLPIDCNIEGYENRQEHSAVSDAFDTGMVFIALAKYFVNDENADPFEEMKFWDNYINKISFASTFGSKCLDLKNPENQIQRQHIYAVKFKDQQTKVSMKSALGFVKAEITMINPTFGLIRIIDPETPYKLEDVSSTDVFEVQKYEIYLRRRLQCLLDTKLHHAPYIQSYQDHGEEPSESHSSQAEQRERHKKKRKL